MNENEKIWQAIAGLHKANDWHLTLCLALVEALKEKGILSDEKVQNCIKDAAREVAKAKFKIQVQIEGLGNDPAEMMRKYMS
jgi:hypothetical protein